MLALRSRTHTHTHVELISMGYLTTWLGSKVKCKTRIPVMEVRQDKWKLNQHL